MTGIPIRRPTMGMLQLGSFKEQPAPLATPMTAQPAPDSDDAKERAQRRAENLRQERELQR